MQFTKNPEKREFAFTRTFNAPRELVWAAWTNCEHLRHWWAPKPWAISDCKIDLRPGGSWTYCMRGPGGEEAWGKAVYREVVAPARLVYDDTFTDAAGNVLNDMPKLYITNEFVAHGDQTDVVSHTVFATVEELEQILAMGMSEGLTMALDQLDAWLAERKTATA